MDLVALVPDQDYEKALEGLFLRHQALGIRPITFTYYRHPNRDAGCRAKCTSFLRPFIDQFDYALVMFDFEGSGAENHAREHIEIGIETDLARNGWAERSAVIVVEPEIEAWVWSDSCSVDEILNWRGHQPEIRTMIKDRTAYWTDENPKPHRPKEALRWALRHAERPKPFSSAIFKDLATKVSFNRCIDPSFDKLRTTLTAWFGNEV